MRITSAVVCDIGSVRRINQDNYYLDGIRKPFADAYGFAKKCSEKACISYAVCDGLGGEKYGEEAASMAVELMKQYQGTRLWDEWSAYINEVNVSICKTAKVRNCFMGTTFAGIVFNGNRARCINVGDSRIYRLRKGILTQLSHDHNEFQLLLEAGCVTKDSMSSLKAKNRLTQHLGIEPEEMEIEPFCLSLESLAVGDCFLLCSDGLSGFVSEEQISSILKQEYVSPEALRKTCEDLVAEALTCGSNDNITAMVLYIEELDEDIVPFDPNTNSVQKKKNFWSWMVERCGLHK